MEKSDFEKFKEIVFLLAEIFDKKLNSGLIGIYWEVLKSVSLDEFERRAKQIIASKTIKVFPLPAEFLSSNSQAIFACGQVHKAMETVGAYESPNFGDPIIPYVIERLGGWVAVCHDVANMESEQRKWWDKEFVKLYQAYQSRDLSKVPVPKLEGIHQRENINAGYLQGAREPERLSESIKQVSEDRSERR
jgi:hypothetical protein